MGDALRLPPHTLSRPPLSRRSSRVIVRVVFIVIDRTADVILALVNLLALLPGQIAPIRRTISLCLAVDA